MSEPHSSALHSIYHPTDFSKASIVAFHHALKLAVSTGCNLEILHVDEQAGDVDDWSSYPRVRDTLSEWGILDADTTRQQLVETLGVDVTKTNLVSHSISKSIAAHLSHNTPSISDMSVGRDYQLVVMATRGQDGAPLWLIPSVSESLSRTTRVFTLFIVGGSKPFINSDTGTSSLSRILLPIDPEIGSSTALLGAAEILLALKPASATVRTLFVGDQADAPRVEWTPPAHVVFEHVTRTGSVTDTILAEADAFEADLIVMATQGRNGFLDALRGSTTDQVVRRAPCPVLAVPTP